MNLSRYLIIVSKSTLHASMFNVYDWMFSKNIGLTFNAVMHSKVYCANNIFIHKLEKKLLLAGLSEEKQNSCCESQQCFPNVFLYLYSSFPKFSTSYILKLPSMQIDKRQLEKSLQKKLSFSVEIKVGQAIVVNLGCQIIIESIKLEHTVEDEGHQRINNRHQNVVNDFPLTINFPSQRYTVLTLLRHKFPQSITEFHLKGERDRKNGKWFFWVLMNFSLKLSPI